MRLDKVYIDGFKNLNDVIIDFDESKLTTVIIGQNGAGKSNLIEAINAIFRWVDLRRNEPQFRFQVDYRIGDFAVCLSNVTGKFVCQVDGVIVTRAEFERKKSDWFPDLIFGYYSGSGRRLEALFDDHQRRYYDAIKLSDDADACASALVERRLFYCRPIHGVLALLSFFAFPEKTVALELKSKLGVSDFHSLLAHFREPWFAKGGQDKKLDAANDFWGGKRPGGFYC
jgi:hypothetical protein